MQLLFFILSVLLLFIIVYQDFKFRAISWFIFPLLFVLLFSKAGYQINFSSAFIITGINFLVVLLIYCCLVIYTSIKKRKLNLQLNGFLGLGDVLFLLAVAPVFSSLNYIFYLLIGLMAALIYAPVHILLFKEKTIPLAGILAVFYSIIFGIDYQFVALNFLIDTNVISLLPWN